MILHRLHHNFRFVFPAIAGVLLAAACTGETARAEGGDPAGDHGWAEASVSFLAPESGDTIDLRSLGYSQGAEDAPVTVIEFSDFGCPFCAMFSQGTYPDLKRDFVDTGRVRWVYVPFVMGMFPNGEAAARAAECAAEQDRFWEMKDRIYAGQKEWRASRRASTLFFRFARDLEIDNVRFASCYRQNRGGGRTRVNNQAAEALRIRATPSFIINGRLVEGSLPPARFRALLTRLSEPRTERSGT